MLRAQRERLIDALARQLGKQVSEDVLSAIDEQIEIGDRSVIILGQEIEFGVLELKRREIRQIDEALARLTAGTYGTCQECGAEIDEARLEILLFATLCVDCKRRSEAEETRVGETGRGFRAGFRDVGERFDEEDEE